MYYRFSISFLLIFILLSPFSSFSQKPMGITYDQVMRGLAKHEYIKELSPKKNGGYIANFEGKVPSYGLIPDGAAYILFQGSKTNITVVQFMLGLSKDRFGLSEKQKSMLWKFFNNTVPEFKNKDTWIDNSLMRLYADIFRDIIPQHLV